MKWYDKLFWARVGWFSIGIALLLISRYALENANRKFFAVTMLWNFPNMLAFLLPIVSIGVIATLAKQRLKMVKAIVYIGTMGVLWLASCYAFVLCTGGV